MLDKWDVALDKIEDFLNDTHLGFVHLILYSDCSGRFICDESRVIMEVSAGHYIDLDFSNKEEFEDMIKLIVETDNPKFILKGYDN